MSRRFKQFEEASLSQDSFGSDQFISPFKNSPSSARVKLDPFSPSKINRAGNSLGGNVNLDSINVHDTHAIYTPENVGSAEKVRAHPRFKNYQVWFQNLLKTQTRKVGYSIVSMDITYDSRNVIAVLKASDFFYLVRIYELKELQLVYEHRIGSSSYKDQA